MSSQPTKQLKIIISDLAIHADIPDCFRQLFGTPDQIQVAITADENKICNAGFDVTSFQINELTPRLD